MLSELGVPRGRARVWGREKWRNFSWGALKTVSCDPNSTGVAPPWSNPTFTWIWFPLCFRGSPGGLQTETPIHCLPRTHRTPSQESSPEGPRTALYSYCRLRAVTSAMTAGARCLQRAASPPQHAASRPGDQLPPSCNDTGETHRTEKWDGVSSASGSNAERASFRWAHSASGRSLRGRGPLWKDLEILGPRHQHSKVS
jgi:hypothetical protein